MYYYFDNYNQAQEFLESQPTGKIIGFYDNKYSVFVPKELKR